ncbi:MAG: transcriptional repressor LexA [Caldilineaceae bacterium]|nr:transcriptional repressor LexA [Caldilineaceae bacterium]
MTTLSARQKNILEFIVAFIQEKEYPPTIREIGEKVGISSTSVVNYNLAKLENEALISRERDVSRGLSVNWPKLLELGFTQETKQELAPPAPPANHFPLHTMLRIPVLGRIAAGEPIQVEALDPTHAEEFVELAQGMLGAPDRLFALKVRGDSMIDASVLDGDIVILRHQETAKDGDMVAAWVEGDEETTLKYLYREGRQIRLQPANPTYKPIVRPAEKVRINGCVVSVIRMLKH